MQRDSFVANFLIMYLWALGITSPIWILIAFGAYVIGRKKQFSVADLIILTTVEAVAIFAAMVIYSMAMVARD